MRQMLDSNPMIRDNPAMRAQMEAAVQNPTVMAQLSDPANLQAILQLQRAGLLKYEGLSFVGICDWRSIPANLVN